MDPLFYFMYLQVDGTQRRALGKGGRLVGGAHAPVRVHDAAR